MGWVWSPRTWLKSHCPSTRHRDVEHSVIRRGVHHMVLGEGCTAPPLDRGSLLARTVASGGQALGRRYGQAECPARGPCRSWDCFLLPLRLTQGCEFRMSSPPSLPHPLPGPSTLSQSKGSPPTHASPPDLWAPIWDTRRPRPSIWWVLHLWGWSEF